MGKKNDKTVYCTRKTGFFVRAILNSHGDDVKEDREKVEGAAGQNEEVPVPLGRCSISLSQSYRHPLRFVAEYPRSFPLTYNHVFIIFSLRLFLTLALKIGIF